MEIGRIERYVSDLMTVSGVDKEGKEQNVGLALYHLLMSAALHDVMSDEDKELFKALTKKLQYFFSAKITLKERKRNKEKKNFPPNLLLKEKETTEKEEKDIDIAGRREVFKKECEQYLGQFDRQRLEDFFYYWAEDVKSTGRMKFELEKTWNTYYRLRRWMNTKHSVENTAAAIRLSKLKQKQGKEVSAQERSDDNARLEQEIEERKRNAVSYEEWQAMKQKQVKT